MNDEDRESSQSQDGDFDFTKLQSILKTSRGKFDRTFVSDSGNVDFSDSIGNYDKNSYETFNVDETYDMKLKRIRHELQEMKILKECAEKQDLLHKVQPVEEINSKEVDGLLSFLSSLELKEDHQVKVQAPKDTLLEVQQELTPFETTKLPIRKDTVSPREVKELENRIFKLERLIGFDSNLEILNLAVSGQTTSDNWETGMKGFQNLESIINDLERKFKLLVNLDNSVHSEETDNETAIGNQEAIKTLLASLESINREIILNTKKLSTNQSFYLHNGSASEALPQADDELSTPSEDSDSTAKINQLYSLLVGNTELHKKSQTDFSKMLNQNNVTALIKRFNTLNSLYLEYESTVSLSKKANVVIDNIDSDFKNWQKIITEANENLNKVSVELDNNKIEIKEWVESLKKAL